MLILHNQSVILRASKCEVLLLIPLCWCGFGGVHWNKLEMQLGTFFLCLRKQDPDDNYVTHSSPAAEKPHQEGSHKASPRAHSIPRNLWCKKKVFAAMYLFVLLSALCATPTHWTLKVSLKVLLSSTFPGLGGTDVAACCGDGWQSALCFCSGKTPKATKAAQQCFLLRMSRGRHLAFILKSYQMRGKLVLRTRLC